jgi:hypothetical protein
MIALAWLTLSKHLRTRQTTFQVDFFNTIGRWQSLSLDPLLVRHERNGQSNSTADSYPALSSKFANSIAMS